MTKVFVIGAKTIDFMSYEMLDLETGSKHIFSKREIELLKLFRSFRGCRGFERRNFGQTMGKR
jgi:hypothetical protein